MRGGKLAALAAFAILTACAGAVAIGAGCDTYREQRRTMPVEDLAAAPRSVLDWVNGLDAAMTRVCR